ncbi:hypothetical protein [uncultured Sphingomonas sp.]|uniref:hypothetical protein n=1 Tax=uncultured Sphingomonas sp. TaxID=158754 RepID=UPI0025FB951E|nr:hypothetical protein [uncultured Sphingomonas sp.]
MTEPPPIDWNMEVELFEPDKLPSLRILRSKMALGDAVEAILAMDRDRMSRSGIGLHKPVPVRIEGRLGLQGYLSGHVVRLLVGQGDFPVG